MTGDFDLPASIRRDFGLDGVALSPLAGDASARRYARLTHPRHGPCLIFTDTPGTPHFEHFMRVAEHLRALGFSTPEVYAVDHAHGVALVEDFGHATYARLLNEGAPIGPLYDLAIDVLAALHDMPQAVAIDLPAYDMDRLLTEVSILPDWYAPAMGSVLSDEMRAAHQSLWRDALAPVAGSRDTLILRDFHVDNLILLRDRPGARACGILDFQDSLIGDTAYDVASLTEDARRDLPVGLAERCLERYFRLRPHIDRDAFRRRYDILAAQRHTKVIGLFHRLNARDGKPAYLDHVPRVLGLLRGALRRADLTEVEAFYDETIPEWSAP